MGVATQNGQLGRPWPSSRLGSLVQGVLLSMLATLTVSKWQPCEIIHKMMKNENLDIVAEDMGPWH